MTGVALAMPSNTAKESIANISNKQNLPDVVGCSMFMAENLCKKDMSISVPNAELKQKQDSGQFKNF